MANATTVQVLLDGPRNAIVKVDGVLDTSDLGNTVIFDPAAQQGMDFTGSIKAKEVYINKLDYVVQDGLTVNLFWDASSPTRIEDLSGRGKQDFDEFGGLVNNAGAGKTGKILLTTTGWSGLKTFTVTVYLVKIGT